MRTYRYLTSFIALVVSAISMNAQSVSFLNAAENSRELAMGGMNVAGDAAIVLEDNAFNASASYYRWSPKGVGTNIGSAEVGYRLGKAGIFAECRGNGYDPYPAYDGNGLATGSYRPGELSLGLGAAWAITPKLAASVLAKYVGSKLAPEAKASAFCADLNLIYRHRNLTAGLQAANIGSRLNYSTVKTPLPMMIKLGVQNDFNLGDRFRLLAGIDAGYISQGQFSTFTVSAGADLKMFDIISVMAGYRFSTDRSFEPSYLSAGLGAEISVVSIAAAYLISPAPVGNTFALSLGFSF